MTAPKKRGRGRPAFKPTPAMRRRVAIAAGGGMTHDSIAMAIGCSDETLRLYFAHELSVGAYRKRIEVLEKIREAAMKGNCSAAKAYLALAPQLAGAPAAVDKPDAAPVDKQPKPQPAVPLGKKEQAQADAHTAATGTEWAGLLGGPAVPLQ